MTQITAVNETIVNQLLVYKLEDWTFCFWVRPTELTEHCWRKRFILRSCFSLTALQTPTNRQHSWLYLRNKNHREHRKFSHCNDSLNQHQTGRRSIT